MLDDEHRNLKETTMELKDNGKDLNFVIDIISAIEHALFAENKHLVFIIGQEPNVYKNLILFVNNLLGRYNVIVSGSANNEVTQIF